MNETLKIKEGHLDSFKKDVMTARNIRVGYLGKNGQANMMLALGLDQILGIKGKKRIRKKRMKQMVEDMHNHVLRNVYRHFEGFDQDGFKTP